jgi:hypothetical protein
METSDIVLIICFIGLAFAIYTIFHEQKEMYHIIWELSNNNIMWYNRRRPIPYYVQCDADEKQAYLCDKLRQRAYRSKWPLPY